MWHVGTRCMALHHGCSSRRVVAQAGQHRDLAFFFSLFFFSLNDLIRHAISGHGSIRNEVASVTDDQ